MPNFEVMKCHCGGTVLAEFSFSCSMMNKVTMRCDKCKKVVIRIGKINNLMKIWEGSDIPAITISSTGNIENSTCKDCLIYDKCCEDAYTQAYYEGKADKVLLFFANRSPCKHFKHKMDYPKTTFAVWQRTGTGITERIVCSNCKSDKGSYMKPPFCSQCGAKIIQYGVRKEE